jgi:hypothetical protein
MKACDSVIIYAERVSTGLCVGPARRAEAGLWRASGRQRIASPPPALKSGKQLERSSDASPERMTLLSRSTWTGTCRRPRQRRSWPPSEAPLRLTGSHLSRQAGGKQTPVRPFLLSGGHARCRRNEGAASPEHASARAGVAEKAVAGEPDSFRPRNAAPAAERARSYRRRSIEQPCSCSREASPAALEAAATSVRLPARPAWHSTP